MEAEDHEGISEELEEEEELLSQLVDAVGHLLKLYGPQFMPVFDQLVVPAFAPYLAAEQPEALQAIAVCLIDDALEFGGVDSAAKYYPQALVTFARTMKSEDIVLRQSSVYGLAQIARLAPQVLAPQGALPPPLSPLFPSSYCPLSVMYALILPVICTLFLVYLFSYALILSHILHVCNLPSYPPRASILLSHLSSFPSDSFSLNTHISLTSFHLPHLFLPANSFVSELVAIITHPEARDDDREGATENALFTLGSIATLPTYREAQYSLQATPAQLSSLWLKNLPLKIDEQIAKLAHCQLCTAVERGDVAVLGEGMANLPELMRIFSEILVSVPSSSLSTSRYLLPSLTTIQFNPYTPLQPNPSHSPTHSR